MKADNGVSQVPLARKLMQRLKNELSSLFNLDVVR